MPVSKAQKVSGPPIDIVFCLDLSNSSNGLIDQFRNHLWDYWYFLSHCEPRPNFRIAVVTYARFSYGKANGYSKVMRDLGTDFERLSGTLYKIPPKVEKGDQYVGAALNTCLKKISWSKDPDAKKMIFLVGNGDVNLGHENLNSVLEKLTENNIKVHAIYCTAPGEREAIVGWQEIAHKTNGQIHTMSIRTHYFDNLNGFDLRRFRLLNRKLNNTYLYYGKNGKLRWRMLQEEDNHAYITNTEGFRYRAMYKISPDYQKKNSSWDLIDLHNRNPQAYLSVEKKLLNDTCKKMTDPELRSFIIYKKYERKRLMLLISKMLADKAEKDKQDGAIITRNPYTLDVISMGIMRDVLKENNCECKEN